MRLQQDKWTKNTRREAELLPTQPSQPQPLKSTNLSLAHPDKCCMSINDSTLSWEMRLAHAHQCLCQKGRMQWWHPVTCKTFWQVMMLIWTCAKIIKGFLTTASDDFTITRWCVCSAEWASRQHRPEIERAAAQQTTSASWNLRSWFHWHTRRHSVPTSCWLHAPQSQPNSR